MMASPQAIAAGNLATTPVGAGAYTVTEFVSGDSVDYTKREGYWDPDAQRVATMTVKLMTDDQTRLNALQSGELDASIVRPVQAISADKSGMKVISRPSVIFLYLLINSAQEPFNDPLVREALNYAVDRVDIGNGLFEGLCDPQIQPWPSTSIAWSDEIGDGLDVWPHDPEKAKELLAEAGYPDGGITMPAVTTNVTFVMQLSEILQAQLAEVGITMTIEPVPTPQVVELFSVNKSVVANVNPYSGSSDPHGIASRHFLPGSVYDVGEPVDPSILELAEKASTPLDPAKRTPIYHEMMQAMIDHPTHLLPLCAQHISVALNPEKVSGVSVYSAGFMDLRGVAVK
jgi:ABC-type transport system substrate-binding protein